MAMRPGYITAYTLSSALGLGNEALAASLRAKRGGISKLSLASEGSTWFGQVKNPPHIVMPEGLELYNNACSRLLLTSLAQDNFTQAVAKAKNRFGKNRIACFLGTITSGLCELEEIYRRDPNQKQRTHETPLEYHGSINSAICFTRKFLGITGPYATISTACSSSAKVFATAHRYLEAGLCDAAVVAGVEPMCETLVYGFRALGVLSTNPCKPWDADRNGINIGAAAGFALIMREPDGPGNFKLMGYGETSDAHHMTSPHPEGAGIELAMRLALEKAGLTARDIDYTNAHGSGTQLNDVTEDGAICRVLGEGALLSSTKGWTGHTQGAAGITEAIIVLECMKQGLVPANLNTERVDPAMQCNVAMDNISMPIRYALSNSMGFGGNNAALIFGAPQ